MKINKIENRWILVLLSFMFSTLMLTSCQKESDEPADFQGDGSVEIHLQGIGIREKSAKLQGNHLGNTNTSALVQTQTFKVGEHYFTATLQEESSAKMSNNAIQRVAAVSSDQPRKFNGNYRISIYQGNTVSGSPFKTFEFKQGDVENPVINLKAGTYTFVTTAYMNPSATGADRDPLASTQTVVVQQNQTTPVSINLLHKLTQVTVRFDATNAGTIQAMTGGTVAPNKSFNFNENTGVVTCGSDLTPKALTFTGQTGTIWTSNPVIIATNGAGRQSDGKNIIHFNAITINNITPNLSFDFDGGEKPWKLEPGTQYTLTIKVGKDYGGILAGGSIWATGNLIYNGGKYGFAAPAAFGDNWFYNWLTPVGVGSQPKDNYTMRIYDITRDPCQMVDKVWHTPTAAQYNALLASPGAATTYNKWYNGYGGTFFGSNNLDIMIQNPSNYLFFIGQTNKVGEPTGDSHYWTQTTTTTGGKPTNDDVTANYIQFQGYSMRNVVNQSQNKMEAIQIRCVREAN